MWRLVWRKGWLRPWRYIIHPDLPTPTLAPYPPTSATKKNIAEALVTFNTVAERETFIMRKMKKRESTSWGWLPF